MLIGSFPSLRLCREVPGLQARQHAHFPLGLSERLQPYLAASTAFLAHSVAVQGCTGARTTCYIHHLLILQPSHLLLAFSLLSLTFSICGTYYSISSPNIFLFLACLLSPPHPPSLLFSLLSTSDPHPITPAGPSSPGTHQGCETDALDQQKATAQPQPPAGSQLSCPSFSSGELKP